MTCINKGATYWLLILLIGAQAAVYKEKVIRNVLGFIRLHRWYILILKRRLLKGMTILHLSNARLFNSVNLHET